jgi:tetratricopeptide (TPR) repeat protein
MGVNPRPPSADAVFVFTAPPAARPEAVGRIVREALASHGGWEVKDEDGSFFLAFQDASVALAWAADTTLALDREGLAVGIGIHAGAAVRRDDPASGRPDWFGPPVNRAARLAQAAHPGQVLAGEAVAAARGDLVGRDLGRHRLRGVPAPEPVWQVLPAELDREFPPPRTGGGPALPPAPGVLHGREDTLRSIDAAWRGDARLVVLVGPGGVGKTALAVHAARSAAERWPVWACSVEGLSADRTTAEAARAVGAGPTDDVPAAVAGRGPALLLLDGLESEAAARVARWLQEAPDLRILATARHRLGVSAEHVVRVEPLAVPASAAAVPGNAAAALLRDRLGSAASRWDDDGIYGILARVGGLPLALEVVAARLAAAPPGEDVPLDEVIGPLGPVDDVVSRALDDLSDEERDVFAQCAAFAGGFDVDAAEAVLEARGSWAVDVLETLVTRALVRAVPSPVDGAPRFELLASMRAAAEVRLRGEARERAERRHASWYARFAEAVLEAGSTRLRAAVLESANLVAAADRSIAIGDAATAARVVPVLLLVAETSGPVWLGVAAAEQLLAMPGVSPPAVALLQMRLGGVLRLSGRKKEAVALLRAAARSGEPEVGVGARIVLANTLPLEERPGLMEEALALAEARGLSRLLGGVRMRIGLDRAELGDVAGAEEAWRAAIGELAASDDVVQVGRVWGLLASLYQRQGRWSEAIAAYDRALSILNAGGATRDEAIARGNFANLLTESGHPDRALPLYEAAAAMHRDAGNRRSLGYVLGNHGMTLHLMGRSARGRALLEEALVLHETFDNPRAVRWVRSVLAEVALDLGDEAEAERRLLSGADGAAAHRARAVLAARRGRMEEAMACFDAAEAACREDANRPELAWTWLREAEAGTPRAADRRDRARAMAAELGWPPGSPALERLDALAAKGDAG